MKEENTIAILSVIGLIREANITSIVKLLYFADLAYFKQTGKRITSYDFVRYKYGPYCEHIREDVAMAMSKGYITVEETENFGSVKTVFVLTPEGTAKVEKILTNPELGSERETIKEIVDDLGRFPASYLGKLSYKTGPMKHVGATPDNQEHMNQALDFSYA